MIKQIDNLKINIKQYGKGEDLVLLHGWGQNIEMMDPVGERLQKDFRVTIVDLPGFGKSSEPSKGFSSFDYSELLEKLFKELKIKKPNIVGHSFGGKVAITYATKNKINKLVLLSVPGYRIVTLKIKLKIVAYKTFKKFPFSKKLKQKLFNKMGSNDYKNASNIMRETMKISLNENYEPQMKKIKCPTLLIWGDKDTAVSLKVAKKMEKVIKDSALIIYKDKTHYAYLENLNQTISILSSFFKEDGGK